MSEFDVAKYPGLYPRNGIWQVRKKVPKDLRHAVEGDQVRRSLGTSDRKLAVELYPLKLAEITEGFKKLREELAAQGVTTTALKTAQIELLGRKEVEKLVSEWWAKREGLRKPQVDERSDPQDMLDTILEEAERLAEQRPEDGAVATRLADRLLVEAGMAAYPRRVGAMRTAALEPAVNRSIAQYRYLVELVGRAFGLESARRGITSWVAEMPPTTGFSIPLACAVRVTRFARFVT